MILFSLPCLYILIVTLSNCHNIVFLQARYWNLCLNIEQAETDIQAQSMEIVYRHTWN